MDLITYVPSLTTFREELRQVAKNPDSPMNSLATLGDGGQIAFTPGKTPVHYNGDESLCIVRIDRETLSKILSIDVLGEVVGGEYQFDSGECKEIYESVLGDRNISYTDENGEYEYQLPYQIGVIA